MKNVSKFKNHLLFISTLLAFVFSFSACKRESPKVGQTYVYVLYKDNPFKEKKYLFWEIIDIKGEYIKYIENEKDTLSDNIIVLRSADLLK